MEGSQFQYDIVNCPNCGTANVKGHDRCRRCRRPLKVRNPLTLPLAVGGGLVLIVLCSGLAIVTARTTPFGAPLALLMFIFSFIFSFIGWVWLLIEGFRAGPLWGLGVLFFGPIVTLLFLIFKPDYAIRPFMLSFLGVIFLIIGVLMIPENIIDLYNQFGRAGF